MVCEGFLGIHPHWGLWRCLYQVKRQSRQDGDFATGGFTVSVRSDVKYSDFRMLESAQNWRLKWFYIRDQPIGDQEYRLVPFSTDEVKANMTWKHKMTDIEMMEADKLMAQIQELQEKVDAVQIITTFIKRRVQPLQARAHTLWLYSGPSDLTRVSKEDFSARELERSVKNVTRLKEEDPLPGEPSVAPYGNGNKVPK
jgi:hypothetical protein